MTAPRTVSLVSYALLAPGEGGHVAGFDPIAAGLPRKNLKTMTRAVQLGVAAVQQALEGWPTWKETPPQRRGLYVGASPQSGDPDDLSPALAALDGDRSLAGFAARAVPMIPPLWLVKGLSNNILGYASAQHDLQGDNGNWCDGRLGGAVAVCNAVRAVAEGRVDLAVAGAADALHGAEQVVGGVCAEGAAFFVVVPGPVEGAWNIVVDVPNESGAETTWGELGAAAVPVALARILASGVREATAGGICISR